ncbi:MAG: HIT domain-containing protein [Actinomycetia bacterium]|nr:HIT domain-containing protein [Actinomycetes bacterium]
MAGRVGGQAGIERLWAGWRLAYIEGVDHSAAVPGGEGSLFERILGSGLPDDQTWILWRGEHCFALLNAYPYTSGHVLVMPNRAVPGLAGLTGAESAELWQGIQLAVAAVTDAYRPEGLNVGFNLGRAAGAGVPDHLHAHVLPRWSGDTNFTTAIAETRVVPEALTDTWRRLRDAWREW